jgi:hypothetical protein
MNGLRGVCECFVFVRWLAFFLLCIHSSFRDYAHDGNTMIGNEVPSATTRTVPCKCSIFYMYHNSLCFYVQIPPRILSSLVRLLSPSPSLPPLNIP